MTLFLNYKLSEGIHLFSGVVKDKLNVGLMFRIKRKKLRVFLSVRLDEWREGGGRTDGNTEEEEERRRCYEMVIPAGGVSLRLFPPLGVS